MHLEGKTRHFCLNVWNSDASQSCRRCWAQFLWYSGLLWPHGNQRSQTFDWWSIRLCRTHVRVNMPCPPPLSVFLVELIAHGASLRRIPSLPGTARPFWREMPAAVNCTQVVRGLGEACAHLCLFACDSIHLCHSVHYKVVAHWSVFKCKTSA